MYDEKLIDNMLSMPGDILSLPDFLDNDAHTLLNGLLIPDGNLPNGPDTPLHKLRIHLSDILPELVQH